MRVTSPGFLLFLCMSFCWSSAHGQPAAVWLVQKEGQLFLVGGTMHLLREQDYPLPAVYDRAYQLADTLVFETDIGALHTPRVQQRMTEMLALPPGTSLQQRVSAQTYAMLGEYLARQGLDVASFSRLKPAMVAMMLTLLEMRRLGLGEAGVDDFFYVRAANDGKELGALETLDEHLEYVANLAQDNEDAFLRYSLQDLDNLESLTLDMLRYWRSGDLEKLNDYLVEPMREEFPQVHRKLLIERNRNWLPQLLAMAQTPEVEFVLVGAAHLPGEEGVLSLLRERGFEVEQLLPLPAVSSP